MAFVSVTRARIRSLRFLPGFFRHALASLHQVRAAQGFLGGSLLADRKWTFWTLTVWDDAQAMRATILAGSHKTAMPKMLDWCDEASVVHWDQDGDSVPDWPQADARMRRDGRASKVRHPSPDHAGMTFAAPRLTAANPIRPAP